VSSIYDATEGKYVRKCNLDVETTIDAIERLADYDEMLLCSGDGDFSKLARYLKNKGKKVTVLTLKDRLSWVLKRDASNIAFLNRLRSKIELKEPETENPT
jgi:uncharacterized LabA/DUF88 family protein